MRTSTLSSEAGNALLVNDSDDCGTLVNDSDDIGMDDCSEADASSTIDSLLMLAEELCVLYGVATAFPASSTVPRSRSTIGMDWGSCSTFWIILKQPAQRRID